MDKDYKQYDEISEFLRVISHPVRLCILKGLSEKKGCNVNYMQECLSLPQSTISTHLTKLRHMGVVTADRRGNEVCYSIIDERVYEILKVMGVK